MRPRREGHDPPAQPRARRRRTRALPPLAALLVAAPTLAGCGATVPPQPSPTATLGEARSVTAALRRPTTRLDRPPWGSMLTGLTDLRRIGPRDVDGLSFWVYVDQVSGQACGESERDPPVRARLWLYCGVPAGPGAAQLFRVAGSDRVRDAVTYGVARDRLGCALLRLEDGVVRRTPIVRNGWARRTPKANPVVSVTATRAGCAASGPPDAP